MKHLFWILLVAGAVAVVLGLRRRSAREAARRRVAPSRPDVTTPPGIRQRQASEGRTASPLAMWLGRAGYRRASAPGTFLLATAAATLLGAGIAVALARAGTFDTLSQWLAETPGGLGDAFQPIAALAPWLIFVLLATIPLVLVRARRRRIVQTVEADLPLALELLASLAQAGLGFDAALERVLQSLDPSRPLASEFAAYRADLLGGASRIQALRRLASRLDVTRLNTFVSALVQSERLGAGLADTLRRQSEDLRNARRETALMRAQALPAKLVFPLVICFLPGVFVITLGPAFFAFLNDSNLEIPTGDR